jgi:putative FmdB family regulatory protein
MPIYAYKCDSCGFAKDVLQKLSDAPLSDCPSCGAAAFQKQLTAAGFQLKGSGWYATDFKGGGKPAAPVDDAGSGAGDSKPDAKPDAKSNGKSEARPAGGADAKKPDAAAKKPDAPARTDSGA